MRGTRRGLGDGLTIGRKLLRVNWLVIAVMAAITGVGLTALYSIGGGSFSPWAERHAVRFLGGAAIMLLVAVISRNVWLGFAYPVYLAALALTGAVLVFGAEAGGAQRWLRVGGISLQPSEIMKLALILALARYYQWIGPGGGVSHPVRLIVPLGLIAAPVALTVLQPDLGTAVLLSVLGLAIMFFAGVNILYFIGGAAALAVALPHVWAMLHPYQRRRVEVFLDPERDPLGAGYHIAQSKIALGAGGLNGRGFMQGTQSQLDFLPEKRTDFIFTMFAEEWGFVGAVVLLALFALFIALLFAMAARSAVPFSRLVIAGTATMIFVYVFINVAMVSGLVPVVGVPLPLVSYGGTAMLTTLVAVGLAMSCDIHRGQTMARRIGAFI